MSQSTIKVDQYQFTGEAVNVYTIQNVSLQLLPQFVEDEQMKIRKWINAPDPSVNFVAAHDKVTEGTGVWFIQDSKFKKWENEGGFLWLQGKGQKLYYVPA